MNPSPPNLRFQPTASLTALASRRLKRKPFAGQRPLPRLV
jgi:hypothetical protein